MRTTNGDARHCVIRTREGDGPWVPCPAPVAMVDFDGDALCEDHLEKLWFCAYGRFNVLGNGLCCPTCQAEEDTP
jgi:hypothetical protein